MAKFNHLNSYFYMYENEKFDVEYDFTNILATGETLSSCTVVMTDEDGTDVTSTMVANNSTSTPYHYFQIHSTNADATYQIVLTGTSSSANKYIARITVESFGSTTLNAKLGDPNANSYVTISEANDYIRNARGHNNSWDTLSIEGKKRLLMESTRDIDKFNFVGNKYYEFQSLEFPRNDHDVLTGDVATPVTNTSFKNTSFTSDTYGDKRNNTDYWKYGSVHITVGTPLYDVRRISASNISTDVITVSEAFTATPNTSTDFIAFEPLSKQIKDAQCEQALYILENSGSDSLQTYSSAGAERVKIGDVEVEFTEGASGGGYKPNVSSAAKNLLSTFVAKTKSVYRG